MYLQICVCDARVVIVLAHWHCGIESGAFSLSKSSVATYVVGVKNEGWLSPVQILKL
jgi:hypothetical protein